MYKVMLVDDEKWILDGLSVMIDWARFGFDVCARARNGREALEAAARWQPELIVTDIRMPNMDGLEMIRQWSALQPSTRFIILSGYSEFSYARQAMQLGVRHYVLKPIEETSLEASLAEVAQEIGALREEASELSLLRRQAQIYLRLQRENMLRDWAHAGASDEELMASLAELEIIFPYDSCCALALEKEDRSSWSDAEVEAVCALWGEIVAPPSAAYAFRFMEAELGVMSSFARQALESGESLEGTGKPDRPGATAAASRREKAKSGAERAAELQEWTSMLRVQLLSRHGVACRIGTGRAVARMQEMPDSFAAARTALGRPALNEGPASGQQDVHRRTLVDEITAYIDQHYEQELTLANIAERFFIHAHYLSPLFRKKTGVTFLHYLTAVRMEHAKRHLLATDLKVYEISRLVGYEDSKYFSKIFERTVGLKPSEYKQRYGKP
ncbi:two-component system, response regulator YesN [Paenibacillus sp. UNCCL117]|uniref:response regulator transcription factor n=1 Tax=unclassified Paenibacillus TaxID=185978 RepID=UPI000881A63B|nr:MULTISPECIES: response regulator [unclassified Paenibacillus]SDE02685.1 two-component system, response regulator YesN [Paenibacillus sp. cl123]SFW57265.1 two-component system, response regulator YesN [Paenibacillus sp. UNCCL117]